MRSTLAPYLLVPLLVLACSNGGPYAPTTSDKNYDDPDDPGTIGQNDPTKDAAAGDASGRFCIADRDCPADFRCSYAIAKGCSAAGACLPFVQSACVAQTGCGCDGVTVTYCLPAGLAPKALKSATACEAPDAAPDAQDDASTADAAAD
ncbi:MAG TPA: hypothetical protein VF316_21690 [Polyangiaceae bacterium]